MAIAYPTSLPIPTARDKDQVSDSSNSEMSLDLLRMLKFVTHTFGATAEHLPNNDALLWRAKSWLKLLTPHFFQPETDYVLQVCCRIRGDRRDAIKADEVLRVAEKVYGCPVTAWGNSGFDRDPQVWSVKDDDWISLDQALERLWSAMGRSETTEANEDRLIEFANARPELLAMIYGGDEQ